MIRLKLSKYDEDHLRCEALEGVEHFGFGTFLCDIQSAEIEADEFSKSALLSATEKSGLNGLEIWADNRIAWGDPSHSVIMPVVEISRADGSEKWLQKIEVTEYPMTRGTGSAQKEGGDGTLGGS